MCPTPVSRRVIAGCAAVALAALVAGCAPAPAGESSGATATVTGRVFYQGKPLPGGGLRFLAADDDRSAFTMINPDGTYRLTGAPVGRVKICVDTSMLRRFRTRGGVTVPEKYRTFPQTDLTYTVRAGSQTYDVRLD